MNKLISGKLTSKGQLTIPVELRNYLALKEGDRLEFVINETGELYVVPKKKTSLLDVAGMLQTDNKIDFDTAREMAHEAIALERIERDHCDE